MCLCFVFILLEDIKITRAYPWKSYGAQRPDVVTSIKLRLNVKKQKGVGGTKKWEETGAAGLVRGLDGETV